MTGALPIFSAASLDEDAAAVRAAFDEAGVVILEGFATAAECAALKTRAFELVD
ncbi:MAG: hypothetical protein HXY21_13055, partial [Parvularculaceae bacterium]|nr:hypothetical protein [Parvularculaceae bacterium]